MKQQVLFEMNIPASATPLPSIREDGVYELLWEMPNGSYVRLLFEDADTVHNMYGKLAGLEMAKTQSGQGSADGASAN